MKTKFMREAIRLSLQKMRAITAGVRRRRGASRQNRRARVESGHFSPTTRRAACGSHRHSDEACRRLKTFRLDDCELYASCEPCPMGLAAGYWARLRKIYYANTRRDAAAIGFDDDFLYREAARRLPPQNSHETSVPQRSAESFCGMEKQAGQNSVLSAIRFADCP